VLSQLGLASTGLTGKYPFIETSGVIAIADALCLNSSLRSLDISNNNIGDVYNVTLERGAKATDQGLEGANLQEEAHDGGIKNIIDDAFPNAASNATPQEPTSTPTLGRGDKIVYQGFKVSVLQEEDQDGDIEITNIGALALVDALQNNRSLTWVNILSNKLDVEVATMLVRTKAEKPYLRTLCGLSHTEAAVDLSREGLGPGDATLLAPEISVHHSLTTLSYV
jgi:hypothetical protein